MINIVVKLIEEKRYAELVYISRRLWSEQSWYYLKRNQKAVQRIKQAFKEITGRVAYAASSKPDTKEWVNRQIAKYIQELGVAVLIDDIRDKHRETRGNVGSIMYFIWNKEGACRWENMLMKKIHRQLEEEKNKYSEEPIDPRLRELALAITKSFNVPEWVVEARTKIKFLLLSMPTSSKDRSNISREILSIKSRLQNNGFPYQEQSG
jgi:hypothetical protein